MPIHNKFLLVLAIALLSTPRGALSDTFQERVLVEIRTDTEQQIDSLYGLKLNIDKREGSRFRVYVRPEEMEKLTHSGLPYTILTEIMTEERAQRAIPGYCSTTPWPCYYTPSRFDTESPPTGSLMEHLLDLHVQHPDITRLYDIGDSQDGAYDILAIKVSDNPDQDEVEPEVRIIAAIHGDETSSMMVACSVLDWIVENYGTDAEATQIVQGAEVWFVPLVNPWGLAAQSRFNSRGIDLNRNFRGPNGNDEPYNQPFTESETRAIRDLTEVLGHRFTTSISFHSGATLFNSVYNYTPAATTDEPIFFSSRSGGPWGRADPSEHGLAEAYERDVTTYGFWFTNGAEWYITRGDTNDWSYSEWGDLDTTVEVTTTKWPNSNQIPFYTEQHRQATINYILKSFQGVSGRMTDNATGQALDGRVEVTATESTYTAVPHAYKAVPTDPRLGDFHRILQPGIYSMTCRAEGYAPLTIENIVVAADATTEIDCSLVSIEGRQHRRPFGGPS